MMDVLKDSAFKGLYEPERLSEKEVLFYLAFSEDEDLKRALFKRARELTDLHFGRRIYFRGLIEFTNFCRKNCYYCGLRSQNDLVERYRMTEEEIIPVVKYGYSQGFRTFVLQGGEDPFFDDGKILSLIRNMKALAPGAAITLSLGERSRTSYQRYKQAGADRYLLRHEAYNPLLFGRLHPKSHKRTERLKALYDLKALGYQVGAGFMVGVPHQTETDIVEDLMFLQRFQPHMVGIGPFVSNKDTPFSGYPNGSADLTLRLLSVIRLLLPSVLLPATTSLETIAKNGRIRGFEHGANVIMPNLTPEDFRRNYKLYDNKAGVVGDIARMKELKSVLNENGFELVIDRGDFKKDV